MVADVSLLYVTGMPHALFMSFDDSHDFMYNELNSLDNIYAKKNETISSMPLTIPPIPDPFRMKSLEIEKNVTKSLLEFRKYLTGEY